VQRHDHLFDPALGGLYEELAPQLLRYAEGILGSRSDAEEAVQDAFLAAASAAPLDEPRPWLFRVTRNAAIDQLRRRRRHLTVLDTDADPIQSHQPSPHDQAELADDLRVLRNGIDRLPEQQRSALMLRELGGLPYRDIADVVDVSEANVKVLIFRARRSLQEFADAVRLPCDSAQMALSAYADREAGKAEFARARLHTATCSSCRTFNTAISGQRAGLAMLVPLAPIAGMTTSGGLLGAAAGVGAKAGGGLGGFFGMKTAATAAAVVIVGTGAVVADHQGIGLHNGGLHKPVPAHVDRAIVPSDPQPRVGGSGGGGGGGAGTSSGSDDRGGGGSSSDAGSGNGRGEDRSGNDGDGGDGADRSGGGGDNEPSSDHSGSGSGSSGTPDGESDSADSGKSDSSGSGSGSGSGKSGSGGGDEPPSSSDSAPSSPDSSSGKG
jgi:RNA polymerase sigma factor (sigma-70 family)